MELIFTIITAVGIGLLAALLFMLYAMGYMFVSGILGVHNVFAKLLILVFMPFIVMHFLTTYLCMEMKDWGVKIREDYLKKLEKESEE